MKPSRFENILKSFDTGLEKTVIFAQSIYILAILVIVLFQFGVFWIYRKTVFLLARIFKGSSYSKPLTLQSGMLANMDTIYTSPKLTIIKAVVLLGIPDIEKIRNIIKTQLLEKLDPATGLPFYPELLQNVGFWLGYPFWRKLDPLKINTTSFTQECVHFYNDDETGQYDMPSLENVTKELCFKPYSKDKPLIEFIILPNYTPHPEKQANLLCPPAENRKYFVLILRLHHALADMYAILRLLLNLSIPCALDTADFLEPTDYTLENQMLAGNGFLRKITSIVALFFKILLQISEYLYKSAIYSSEGSLWNWDQGTPKDAPPVELVQNYGQGFNLGWSKSFTLREINEIKKLHSVSGTAVMYAALLGCIRKTMFSGCSSIPHIINFGMTLPLPRTNQKLRNHSALMSIFLEMEEDPIQRLLKVQKQLTTMKSSTVPIVATFLTNCSLGLPPALLAKFIDEATKGNEFVTVSNIAGPRLPSFNVAGYLVQDIFFMSGAAIERNCLFICMFSLNGRMKLVLTGNSELLTSDENAQHFNNFFLEELQILKQTSSECKIKQS